MERDDEKTKILLAALLWLRNHHTTVPINGIGMRRRVAARIDRVLMDHDDLRIDDMRAFRKAYPPED